MAGEIGTLVARIVADTSDLEKGVSKAQDRLEKLGASGAKAGLALAGGLLAATAAVAALAQRGIALADELKETADKIGITADELAGLRYSAQLAGVESTALEMAIKKLAKGGTDAAEALKFLGIKQEELRKLPLTEQLLKVGDALNGVHNETSRLALSQAILGKSGSELSGMFRQGTDAIRAQIAAATELGLTLDEHQVQATQQAADAQDTLKASVNGLSMQLGAALSPAFKASAEAATHLVEIVTAAIPKLQSLAEKIFGVQVSAAALSNDALRTRLIDTFNEISTIEDSLADMRRIQPPQLLEQDGNYNNLLKQRSDLLARQNDLLGESVKRKREDAAAQAAKSVPGAAGSNEKVFDPEQTKKDAAAELALVTAVFAEQDRLAALEVEQNKSYRDMLFTESETFYTDELQQLKDWGALLAAERDKQTADEIDATMTREGSLTQIRAQGRAAEKRFDALSTDLKVQTLLGSMVQMTAGTAQSNKKMFDLNKKLALANAAVSLPDAVIKSFQNGGGYPWGLIPASLMAVTGLAQIKAIKSTTFEGGGGGTTPSAAGSTPTVNGNPTGQGESDRVVTVRGLDSSQLFSGRQVVDLLNAAMKDGAKLVLQP